jgi:cell division protein FtsB
VVICGGRNRISQERNLPTGIKPFIHLKSGLKCQRKLSERKSESTEPEEISRGIPPMSLQKEYQLLQRKVEELKKEVEQAKGAKREILKQLQKQFGCATISSAEGMIAKKKKELERLETELEKDIRKLNEHLAKVMPEGNE